VDSVRVEADAPVAGVVMTTGTDFEEAFVTAFSTCSWTVVGVAMLLLVSELVRVFESMTDVESALPFQRMTVSLVKLLPETLMVWFFEPAAMVWGTTWLIVGVTSTGTSPAPQPRQK
jgi:ABC-type glucose/galactose transport system permease subunit